MGKIMLTRDLSNVVITGDGDESAQVRDKRSPGNPAHLFRP
jgi:hypothetical protein